MPLSKCRYCGKKVTNPYRPYHENVLCLVMRRKRGDSDVIFREVLPKVLPNEEVKDKAQKKLFELDGMEKP